MGADLSHYQNIYGLANVSDTLPTLPLDTMSEEKIGMMMMTKGMTAKDFDPVRYSGRWFEVASLKRGFAGAGQEDCHCTQVCTRKLFFHSFIKNRKSVNFHSRDSFCNNMEFGLFHIGYVTSLVTESI